jgi:hypothetical protein
MKGRGKRLRSIAYSKLNTEKLIEVSKIICSGLAGFEDSHLESFVKNLGEMIVEYETLSSKLKEDKESSKALMAEIKKKGKIELALFDEFRLELDSLSKDADGRNNNSIIFVIKQVNRHCKTNDFDNIQIQISKISLIAYIMRRAPFDELLQKYPSLQTAMEKLGKVSDEIDALNDEYFIISVKDHKLVELKKRKSEMVGCVKSAVGIIDHLFFIDKKGEVNPVAEDINFLLYDLLGDSE